MSQDRTNTTSADDGAAKSRQKFYKQSLNLPKTSFPMRANLAQNEPKSRKRWDERNLYRELLAARQHADRFVFHDGPPYANGQIHVGHLLNKVLKDFVVRSQLMRGRSCPFVPGWDCHGLPIEHRVLGALHASGKLQKIDALEEGARRMAIRRECARYADKFQKLQADQMQRLLTLADYDDPYLTMRPQYEHAVLEVFAELVAQGLVYRDLKPVHWSIDNRTALAEAELEYRDREDPSVYVHFDAADPGAVGRVFGIESEADISFMIWTTTPWTLAANLLIAVHPAVRYSLVHLEGRLTVLASELVESVRSIGDAQQAQSLGEVTGSDLVGLVYSHPFINRTGRIVQADYVTLEDGTGLVHTAPGHGQEDFETGLREGLPIYCPVLEDGTYDESVPDWLRGLSVWEANEKVMERLRATGHMFHDHLFVHSYPHDWRSKTPTIFRCTEQWFVSVDRPTLREGRSLRQMALEHSESQIGFIPEWGRNRLRGMLESRPDWCISRQRSWGLPIPAFRRPDGQCLLTVKTIQSVAEVFRSEGSDTWFSRPVEHLLANYEPESDPDAPAGLDVSRLEKMYDIFDVWFESGSSWHAVMRSQERGFPIDLYLEGSDQHRGWFQLSLLPGLGATGQSPFRSVLTHGFCVDKDGHKMSKSAGNALEVEDLLDVFGADVCRWWVSSLAFESDVKVDREFFELAGESYRKVRNTLRFFLSNLYDYRPDLVVDLDALPPTSLDRWALERTTELRRRVLAAYERFEFRQAHLLLFDFCNETMSAIYLDAVKDRLYCDRPESPRRCSTQAAMRRIAEVVIHLLAPILPHTADEAWQSLLGDDDACVQLGTHPQLDFDADPRWFQVLELRERVRKALEEAKQGGIENPYDAAAAVPDPDGVFGRFAADLADVLKVSRVELLPGSGHLEIRDLRDQPRCERSWRRDDTVRQRSDGGWLSDRDAEAVGLN